MPTTHGDEYKGRAKEALGDLTGSDDLKREGKADKASGKVKRKIDQATDKVKDVVNDKNRRDTDKT